MKFLMTLLLLALGVNAASLADLSYSTTGGKVIIYDCDTGATGELMIPDSIEGNPVVRITSYAFRDCTSLTSITIPDCVTTIGDFAFRGCTSLTTIEIGAENGNYTDVDGVLFNKEKTDLLDYPAGKGGNYTIPDSVTSIWEYSFAWSINLTSIMIPDSVTSIGAGAFLECTSLTSITIPDSITSIGEGAFGICASVTNVTIGNGVTSIRLATFAGCDRLTSITIGNGVTSMGRAAFFECTSLTSITLPDSVTSIGFGAFFQCNSLTAVTFLGDAPKVEDNAFEKSSPTIYRKPEAKGWSDTFAGRPVKLITEKP
tara:strand:+ start:2028 stop:2972 length:945 start_codon:yes stop_codon:yes gene_type:complete